MTHQSWQQEHFSLAYLGAVASAAGYALERRQIDYDGIDVTFHAMGASGSVRSPRLDAQVKSQVSGKPKKFPWKYKLEVDNYEHLRHADYAVARVLIVVAMPKDAKDWLSQSPGELALRHCAYWISLRGQPATTNKSTITVALPAAQNFSPAALQQIMLDLGQGKLP